MTTVLTSFAGHLGHYWILDSGQTIVDLIEVVDPRVKVERHFGI